MAWTQVNDYVPSGGPIASGAAGSTIGGGWIDVHGSQWSIDASNRLTAANNSSAYNTGELARPIGEAQLNSRQRVKFSYGATAVLFNYHRWSNSGTAATGYAAGIDFQVNKLQFYLLNNGSPTSLGLSTVISPALTAGTTYILDTNVVQTNGTTTALTATLFAADGTTQLATYSITDTTAGMQNVSSKPTALYTNSAPSTYITEITTYSGSSSTILTNTSAFHFSPANWKGDTGRGGSVYRQTWNSGAYFDFVFTAGASPTATLNLASNANSLPISYFVNGVLADNVATASLTTLALTNLVANAVNTVRVYVRHSPSTSRWGGTNTLQIQSITLDIASAAGVAVAPTKWVLYHGDSINEGWLVDAGSNNFLHSSTFFVVEYLRYKGWDVGVVAATGAGFLTAGNGSVPALYSIASGVYTDSSSRWNKLDSGVSLLDSASQISSYGSTGTTPDAIFMNYGTNDANTSVNQTDLLASVTGSLVAFAGAAPAAKIILVVGLPIDVNNVSNSAATLTSLTNGFNAAKLANSSASLTFVDLGAALGQQVYGFAANHYDSFHPTLQGNAYLAPRFQDLMSSALISNSTGSASKAGVGYAGIGSASLARH